MAPSRQLHFNRSIEIGPGYMRSKSSTTGEVYTIHVQKRHIKGPPSDYATLKGKNEQNLDTPNIFHGEFIRNEPGDYLLVEFEGYLLNNCFFPKTPDSEARAEILQFLELFRDKGGFGVLARYIFQNIVNLRWLRRNNEIFSYKRQVVFKTHEFEHSFTLPDWNELPALEEIEAGDTGAVRQCIAFIESRLHKSNIDRWFKVEAELYTGRRLNIFPAQEMNIGQINNNPEKNHSPGRMFVKGIDEKTGKATIPLIDERHILHALYTYDYSYTEDIDAMPINVNPCGFHEEKGRHYRDYQQGNCVYNYQEQLSSLTKKLQKVNEAEDIPDECHYLCTNYLKGGVFGEKSE